MRYFIRLFASVVFSCMFGVGQAQFDYFGDGKQQILQTRIDADNQLHWYSVDAMDGRIQSLGPFGNLNTPSNVGAWTKEKTFSRGYILKDELGHSILL